MIKHLPLITRLTRQIGTKEYPDARDEAKRILRERGHMHKNSERLTKAGQVREAMGPIGRAIDRAATQSGRPKSDYKYVVRDGHGRAVLK
jgi:hypothetical protein